MPRKSGELDEKPKRPADGTGLRDISADDIAAILAGTHSNPFAVLGVHRVDDGFVARCFILGAEAVTATALDGTVIGELDCLDSAGFFTGEVKLSKQQPVRYRARRADAEWAVTDPIVSARSSVRWTTTLPARARICACSTRWAHIR